MRTRTNNVTRKVSRATLRPYILLTLTHAEAEKRRSVTSKEIVERISRVLRCNAIIVSKEKHQAGGFHFHIGIESTDASRNTASRLLRDSFPEFEGAQCLAKFHKSWATICAYVTKEDKKPRLWGKYTMDHIREQADIVRRHRRGSHQNHEQTDEIYTRLKDSKQWLDVYKDPILREANLKRYQNIKKIFQDLKTIEQIERDPLQALSLYLKEKGYPEEYDIEHLKEKYLALDWLAINLAFPRSLKTKQLCIQGRPSSQKSLILKLLSEVIATYFAGTRMNDFTDAHDFFYLWVIDEFKEPVKDSFSNNLTEAGQVYLNTLLRILDGQECKLDAKYQSVFTKRNNVPVICATNELGDELRQRGPLHERFIFTVFNTKMQDLKPERLLATLYGCVLRRVAYRCQIAGEEQKRIMEAPESIRKIMRANEFEIRYNEIEVEMQGIEIENDDQKGIDLVFSPEPETKKGVYAHIEKKVINAKQYNPEAQNPEMEEALVPLTKYLLNTSGWAALNKKKVGLLEIARVPLKKRIQKRKKKKGEEGQEAEVDAYVMTYDERGFDIGTGNEHLLVYRSKSTKEEDYASWPMILEFKRCKYSSIVLKTNLAKEGREKKRRFIRKAIEGEDREEKQKIIRRAVLKLGVNTVTNAYDG